MIRPTFIFPMGAPQSWTTAEADEDDDVPEGYVLVTTEVANRMLHEWAVAMSVEDDEIPDPPKCEDCGGRGKIELFTGVVDCERCGGSGY